MERESGKRCRLCHTVSTPVQVNLPYINILEYIYHYIFIIILLYTMKSTI